MRLFLFFLLGAFFLLVLFLISPKNPNSTQTNPSPETSQPKTLENNWQTPILMYHYIRDYQNLDDKIGVNLSVSPANLEKQLQELQKENYQTINFIALKNPESLPAKPIILTFDDGYRDAYATAFPLLKKYGFKATFYVVSGFVGRNDYLTKEEILKMAGAGMNIGSHTISHPDLTKLTPEKARKEILESKARTKEWGIEALDFAYPAGKYNEEVTKMVKEAGYQSAVTTQPGTAKDTNDFFQLPRVRMENETNLKL
ncbi:polysaccharide deacetylase family protein [Candidatus Berkelbacteria bacterium]|nr:polysaccharide deacetylase family protein [Candidatus Berkelbacteria bacterium]